MTIRVAVLTGGDGTLRFSRLFHRLCLAAVATIVRGRTGVLASPTRAGISSLPPSSLLSRPRLVPRNHPLLDGALGIVIPGCRRAAKA